MNYSKKHIAPMSPGKIVGNIIGGVAGGVGNFLQQRKAYKEEHGADAKMGFGQSAKAFLGGAAASALDPTGVKGLMSLGKAGLDVHAANKEAQGLNAQQMVADNTQEYIPNVDQQNSSLIPNPVFSQMNQNMIQGVMGPEDTYANRFINQS